MSGALVELNSRRRHATSGETWRILGVYNDDICTCESFPFAVEVARALVKAGTCAYATVESGATWEEARIHFMTGNRKLYDEHMEIQRQAFGHVEPEAAEICIDHMR